MDLSDNWFSPSSLNFESFRNDISRLQAVLKEDTGSYCSDDLDLSEESHDLSSYGAHLANRAEIIISEVIDGSRETGYVEQSELQSQPDDLLPLCLEYCNQLKDSVTRCIAKLDVIDNEIATKQKLLEDKLAISVKLEKEEKKKIKYYKPINLFATPYFRDVRKSIPSPNEDSILKKLSRDVDAYTAPPRPWTDLELRSLREAVVHNSRLLELQPFLTKREYYKDKLLHGLVSEEQIVEADEKLQIIEDEIIKVRRKTTEELLNSDKELDWMRISTTLSLVNRTPEECHRMWYNFMHPSINKKRWTKEEDEELRKVAKHRVFSNWKCIAKALKLSKRTSIQCLERYQSGLNPRMLKSAWTPEDDDELINVVETFRIGNYIPWNQVSYHVDGRSRIQILNRWTRSIAPSLKKGPWSNEEDAVLLAAVEKYGYQWSKMESLLPGRSGFACRERYTNVLLPGVTVGNWSREEDIKLVKLIRRYPEGKWTKIAAEIPGRTDNMCLQRAARLKKHHPHLFDKEDLDEELDIESLDTPTHNCRALNRYREHVRLSATESMIETMMKVRGYQTAEEAKASLGSKTSHSCLVALSKQLLGDHPEENVVSVKRSTKKIVKPKLQPRLKMRETTDSEEEDADDIHLSEDSDEASYFVQGNAIRTKQRTEDEKVVDEKLDTLFLPLVSYTFPVLKRKKRCLYQTHRYLTEEKLLKSLLYKALYCCEEQVSEEVEPFAVKGVDFAVSVPSLCQNLLFHVPSENEMSVLSPNNRNLEAFKFLLLNSRQLNAVLYNNPCTNKKILSLISSNENCVLFCTSCYMKEENISQGNVVVNLPDSTTDESMSFSGASSQVLKREHLSDDGARNPSCTECQRLNALRKDYHLLRKRLFTLFFWPALLTVMKPSEEQRICLLKKDRTSRPASVKERNVKRKKVKRKKFHWKCNAGIEGNRRRHRRKKTNTRTVKVSKKGTKQAVKYKCHKSKPLHATRKSPRHVK